MRQMIELDELNRLLKAYTQDTQNKKSFSEWISIHRQRMVFVVDSIGIVTEQDFYPMFQKEYVKDRFEDLANAWYKFLSMDIDFGDVLNAVFNEFDEDFQMYVKRGLKQRKNDMEW